MFLGSFNGEFGKFLFCHAELVKVYFLFLPLENNNANHGNAANAINVSNFEDLYMKMNARGKQLTDFEIFKAKLQDSKEIMTELCKAVRENDDATEVNDTEIINYISKYNNEFADLFYDIVGNDFDKEMFAFFELMIATNFFSEIAKKDTSNRDEKKKEYQGIKSKSGIELFNYISATEHKKEKLYSLEQIYNILKILSKNNELISKKDKETILKCSTANFSDDVRIFALVSFIIKFEKNFIKKEYEEWKRFVNNILNNSDLKNADEAYTTCTVLIKIMENVYKNNGHVLETLKDIETTPSDNSDSKYPVSYAIQSQLIEEKIKAQLMYNCKEWETAIKKAENYFQKGYIAFLLCISKDDNGYNIGNFNKYFEIISKIIKHDYKLQDSINFKLINDVLLSLGDKESLTLRKIQVGDVFSFVFNKNSFNVKWKNEAPSAPFIKPWKELCEKLFQNQKNENANINDFLEKEEKIIRDNLFDKFSEFDKLSKNANWKEKWILLENEHKQPTIDLRLDYIYLFDGTRNINASYELNTCLLYSYIKHKFIDKLREHWLESYTPVRNQDVLDENKLPRRYFTFKGWKIAFCPDSNKDHPWWIWKDETVPNRYSTADIYDEIKNLNMP